MLAPRASTQARAPRAGGSDLAKGGVTERRWPCGFIQAAAAAARTFARPTERRPTPVPIVRAPSVSFRCERGVKRYESCCPVPLPAAALPNAWTACASVESSGQTTSQAASQASSPASLPSSIRNGVKVGTCSSARAFSSARFAAFAALSRCLTSDSLSNSMRVSIFICADTTVDFGRGESM